jgi:tetratricopeptide (TPR) repeat protein
MGNGFLKNGELQEAINRYEFVHKIFSKHRIDENYGIILEKLGLISIYQKKFDKGINYINLAIEIHERYLEFPLRQLSILRMNLYILFHFAY